MREAAARTADAGGWPLPVGTRLVAIGEDMIEPVEHLLDLAFGYDRHQRTAYRLRERVAAWAPASFAAFEGDRLTGSLQTWPLALTASDGAVTPLWLVGPIAVHPDRRSRGLGRAMLAHALETIDRRPEPALLIGDPDYYAPFGFSADRTAGWQAPGPIDRHRLLARAAPDARLPSQGMLGPRT